MGQGQAKEARGPADNPHPQHHQAQVQPRRRSAAPPTLDALAASYLGNERPPSRSRNRVSRGDLGLFSLGSVAAASAAREDAPFERRETRAEREARRLEKERVARQKEREKSLKEEHVDGGYLVTLGVYTGVEDFSKPIVRQLQIERRIAPFWRGLQDLRATWSDYQLISAARGLPIPPADETPPEGFMPKPASESPVGSSQNLNSLTVPMGPRSLSVASDKSGSATNASSALPSPTSAGPNRTASPFKPRAKAIAAALTGGSRSGSTTDLTWREVNLRHDPLVNGQPIESFLYRNAEECPICFLYYPPYLNHTRCCDQPICSECFVQIKRPDPHHPETHGEPAEQRTAEQQAETLISEPACCPYCQVPEFGVTYQPPPFRRGLSYSSGSAFGAIATAMSSTSSLNSATSPALGATLSSSPQPAPTGGRRRNQSLSVHNPSVITTDRIRPDWATKLAAQKANIARRAAAATALHTAAFLMNGSGDPSRQWAFSRPGRFSRRNTGNSGGGGADGSQDAEGSNGGGAAAAAMVGGAPTFGPPDATSGGIEAGPRTSSGRGLFGRARTRVEDLEEMMMMEAVRLSLAEEEERRRKAEKEARKEAKKRDKEERKAIKDARKRGELYAGDSGMSSPSGSSLSLAVSGLGRKRGNSSASGNLRVEASVANALATSMPVAGAHGAVTLDTTTSGAPGIVDKGKGKAKDFVIDTSTPDASSAGPSAGTSGENSPVEHVDVASPFGHSTVGVISIPSSSTTGPQFGHSRKPSHLRHMSNASSIDSSLPDSVAGSYQRAVMMHDAGGSSISLPSGGSEDRARAEQDNGTEPMFNFRSLAEMVGVQMEGPNAGLISPPALDHCNEPAGQTDGTTVGKNGDVSSSTAASPPNPAEAPTLHAGDDATQAGELGNIDSQVTMVAEPDQQRPNEEAVGSNNIIGGDENGTADKGRGLPPPELTITPETPGPAGMRDSESKQLGAGFLDGREVREVA